MSSGCGAPLTVPPSLLVAPQIEAARGATAVAAGRGQPRWLRQAGAAAGRRARAGCRMWPRQLTRWGGWHRGSGCSAERGRNQTGCYYVAACGSSRPTARPRARPRWLLCSVEWSGASAMSRSRLRIRTAPRTAERGSDYVEGARALTGEGEGRGRGGKQWEAEGMGAHEHGGPRQRRLGEGSAVRRGNHVGGGERTSNFAMGKEEEANREGEDEML